MTPAKIHETKRKTGETDQHGSSASASHLRNAKQCSQVCDKNS